MKLEYFADTDSLYVDFRDQPSVESAEIASGVVVDYDADGRVVGIDITSLPLNACYQILRPLLGVAWIAQPSGSE